MISGIDHSLLFPLIAGDACRIRRKEERLEFLFGISNREWVEMNSMEALFEEETSVGEWFIVLDSSNRVFLVSPDPSQAIGLKEEFKEMPFSEALPDLNRFLVPLFPRARAGDTVFNYHIMYRNGGPLLRLFITVAPFDQSPPESVLIIISSSKLKADRLEELRYKAAGKEMPVRIVSDYVGESREASLMERIANHIIIYFDAEDVLRIAAEAIVRGRGEVSVGTYLFSEQTSTAFLQACTGEPELIENLPAFIRFGDDSLLAMQKAGMNDSIGSFCIEDDAIYVNGVELPRNAMAEVRDQISVEGQLLREGFLIPLNAGKRFRGFVVLSGIEEKDELGEIEAILKLIALAVDRSMLERELAPAKSKLLEDQKKKPETERLKNEIIMITSHELRKPITRIKGYALTLAEHHERLIPEERAAALESIERGCRYLTEIIEDMINIEFIERKKIKLRNAPFDTEKLLEDIGKLMQDQDGLYNLEFEIQNEVRTVTGDFGKIQHILMHLIDNAMKFSAKGSTIKVTAEEMEHSVLFSVRDEGVGISEDRIENLFLKMEPPGDVLHHSKEGMGIGLYICRVYVEAMGGDIWIESKPDIGTSVFFTLPKL